MPLIRRSYLDLSLEQRRGGAKAAKARLKAAMANPSLTSEQAQQLRAELQKIQAWESGTLP
jgi:hypothetical protein